MTPTKEQIIKIFKEKDTLVDKSMKELKKNPEYQKQLESLR